MTSGTLVGMAIVLFLSVSFWFVGTMNQRISNKSALEGCKMRGDRAWVYLFGLCPGEDRLYLRPLIMQLLAFVYCLFGGLAVLRWERNALGDVTAAVFLVGLVVFGIAYWISDSVPRQGRRA